MVDNNDHAVELLYGGAKGGGKSYFGCWFCFGEALRLIELCGLEPSNNPIPVGFMGRKIGQNFEDTTFETWKKFIPSEDYKLRDRPADIIIRDTVKILTGGLDRTETVNKFNSAELAFYFLDQAEETIKDDVGLLRAATFWRLTLNGHQIPGKGLLTANPAQCWLKQEFIDAA